jgi:hypothetical protein
LNRHDLRSFVQQIQAGEATFLGRQSNRTSVWLVTFRGNACRVVYDKQRKTIVTFLPTTEDGTGGVGVTAEASE